MSKTLTYTAHQVTTGDYDMLTVFGYVVVNPLPYRLVGFDEAYINGSYVEGLYEASIYCGETYDDCVKARGYRDVVIGIYRLQDDGRTWKLIPDSWKKSNKAIDSLQTTY